MYLFYSTYTKAGTTLDDLLLLDIYGEFVSVWRTNVMHHEPVSTSPGTPHRQKSPEKQTVP